VGFSDDRAVIGNAPTRSDPPLGPGASAFCLGRALSGIASGWDMSSSDGLWGRYGSPRRSPQPAVEVPCPGAGVPMTVRPMRRPPLAASAGCGPPLLHTVPSGRTMACWSSILPTQKAFWSHLIYEWPRRTGASGHKQPADAASVLVLPWHLMIRWPEAPSAVWAVTGGRTCAHSLPIPARRTIGRLGPGGGTTFSRSVRRGPLSGQTSGRANAGSCQR